MNTFYEPRLKEGINHLSEEESKHCVQVLRHQVGDEIELMDGQGLVIRAKLTSVNKKKCEFEVVSKTESKPKPFQVHLAIAPTKSIDRMEWMVEKLSEIGVDEITFLKTDHSERGKIRIDRIQKKAISAMKQCKFPFLTRINDLTSFSEFVEKTESSEKWMAHVGEHPYLANLTEAKQSTSILIGPEGDFSSTELELAAKHGFQPVSLGKTTLRTETAGLLACHFVNVVNGF